MTSEAATPAGTTGPIITITYCTQCNWLLRAGWMAQELLHTFAAELGEVRLAPGTGGVFTIDAATSAAADPTRVWDRKADGGFPGAAELKNRVRDAVFPDWKLGKHVDNNVDTDTNLGEEY